jgi:S-adenosylmethionine:tRNA ribosyltransferase-isomerase
MGAPRARAPRQRPAPAGILVAFPLGRREHDEIFMSELDQYEYELPRDQIAQHPLSQRTDARLMLLERESGRIEHFHIRDLPELLRAGDVLVLNDSRVIPARLVGVRTQTRGRWQGLYLRSDPATGVWELLSRTRGRIEPGETLTVLDRHARETLPLRVMARTEEGNLLVQPQAEGDAPTLLQRYGRVPLPPYIRDGQMVDRDVESYQTVYARQDGSVAAPTAGLHFTRELFERLQQAGVTGHAVTLHVGLGTFRPIAAERLEDHRMHLEWGQIDATTAAALNAARSGGGRIVAVGTTSARVLETAADDQGQLHPWTGQTDLFIRPGYRFKAVDAMLTNFHLPRSSLLVMIAALAGRERVLDAYQQAIRQGYRFYSYGDAMLIL